MATFKRTTTRPIHKDVLWTPEVTINGATDLVILNALLSELPTSWGANQDNRKGVITNIYVQYVTNCDTTSSANIRIGNKGNIDAHTSAVNTVAGKVTGDVDVFPQSGFDAEARLLTSDEWLAVKFTGGTGAGVVKVGVEVSNDYTDWTGFTPQTPN